jgi:hypothetical protein
MTFPSQEQATTVYSLIMKELEGLRCTPLEPGVSGCPCCYKTCVAACGDACMGMARFSKCAQRQEDLLPIGDYSAFVPDAKVALAQEQRKARLASGAKDQIEPLQTCSDFKAATSGAKTSQVYDITGVAAFVCRHGFVLRAATMTSAENYTYYEVQLEDILRWYSAPGRQLCFIFVDVACRMQPTLNRYEHAVHKTLYKLVT